MPVQQKQAIQVNPFEAPGGPVLGKAVFLVPEYEPDPKGPAGRMRPKRDPVTHEVIYTTDSIKVAEQYVATSREAGSALGPAASDPNPVLSFYRQEFAYQAGKERPKTGPFSHKNEIPIDTLRQLKRDAALPKVAEGGPTK